MKKRKRLSESEAMHLCITPRPRTADGQNPKYVLDIDQQQIINELRSGNKAETKATTVKTFTETSPNNYSTKEKKVVLSAWDSKTETMMDIDTYCKKYKLPLDDITSYKLVSHTGTPFYNIVFKTISEKIKEDLTEEFINQAIATLVTPCLTPKTIVFENQAKFDRLIYTDVHIGMDTDKDGTALYPVKWDEVELMKRMYKMVEETIALKTSNMLIIDELGDLMDGWDGKTTRGGHDLPQNMSNKEAFDVALKFKVRMIQELAKHYDFIKCNNICNDNHAGEFGYIVNSAFKSFIEVQYPNHVMVENFESFINHYRVYDKRFVITHGKDSKSLKFGFKPNLDTKQIEKIDAYMKHHKLYDGCDIEFSKGDSHQQIFDMAGSDDFDYFNYAAFSPSSEWVQTNFKKGRSGFVNQNFDGKRRTITPYFF